MGSIDHTEPRGLFAELVAGALESTRVDPSPLATAYLIGLLDAQVRLAPVAQDADGADIARDIWGVKVTTFPVGSYEKAPWMGKPG